MNTQNTIQYQFDFSRFNEHLVNVHIRFIATETAPILWLPSWIAGSYLIREFARHITAVTYQCLPSTTKTTKTTIQNTNTNPNTNPDTSDSPIHRATKIRKNEWYLSEVNKGDEVNVYYEVYCYDLSVRTAYIDQTRLYGNFTSLALTIEGRQSDPIDVILKVPNAFIKSAIAYAKSFQQYPKTSSLGMACGLPHTQTAMDGFWSYHLSAKNYEQLIDHPFEIADQAYFDFQITDNAQQTILHRFFISGHHQADLTRLSQDIQRICQTYVRWLEDTPFMEYTFMTFASGQDYGGLEHINSTSLITPRNDLPSAFEGDEPSDAYQRFLGLCSHEYFHAWWVKTVRPDVMMTSDLRQEAYTSLLWVFEGFTSYLDDFMLQASHVISHDSYLKLLSAQIDRYYQTQGRALQSVAESSFDAWIKLYRSDENTANAGISYYNKGALVALCLDLILYQHGARLFDVIKIFYQKAKDHEQKRIGMSEAILDDVLESLLPKAVWQSFKENHIHGVKELPLKTLLNTVGITVNIQSEQMTWGIKASNDPMGLKVQRVIRQSPAAQAGISAHDIIIAIDGIKASEQQLKHAYQKQQASKQALICHVFRRDELLQVSIPPSHPLLQNTTTQLQKWSLSIEGQVPDWLSITTTHS